MAQSTTLSQGKRQMNDLSKKHSFWTMYIILFAVFTSLVLAACGLSRQDAPTVDAYKTITPSNTSEPGSQATETTVVTPVLNSTLTATSTPVDTCASYTPNASTVYLDEVPVFILRQGPGCEYEAVTQSQLFKSNPLAFYKILGKQGDWLLVDLCNDRSGWLFAPAIHDVNIHINSDALSITTPVVTPAVSAENVSLGNAKEAKRTLVSFFNLLYERNYEEAARMFGGGYGTIIMWNPDLDAMDYPGLLKRACEQDGFRCFFRIKRIVKTEQISSMEYLFTVEFMKEDGSLYRFGNPQDNNSKFSFRVVRDCDGRYLVVDWPIYTG